MGSITDGFDTSVTSSPREGLKLRRRFIMTHPYDLSTVFLVGIKKGVRRKKFLYSYMYASLRVNERMRDMTQRKADELSQISLRDPKGIPIGS